MKNDINININTNQMEIEDLPQDKFVIGKYTYEDKNGKIINEKMFLGYKNKIKEGEYNPRFFKENNNNEIMGYITNGLP